MDGTRPVRWAGRLTRPVHFPYRHPAVTAAKPVMLKESKMAGRNMGRFLCTVVVTGALVVSGCQTQLGGMTLPSNDYLRQNPTYFQPAPTFKLPKEAMAQEAAARNLLGPNGRVPGPANVPAPGGPMP